MTAATTTPRPQGIAAGLVRLMRLHHWGKNAFILLPLFFTPAAHTPAHLIAVLTGIIAFGLAASAVYILNDIMDREADRAHPTKCLRPLAAGTVPLPLAVVVGAGLAGSALALAWSQGPAFLVVLGVYLAMNVGYSLGLKHVSVVDVMIIALGFVLRVEAGAVLIRVEPTSWILICSGLLALFLALAKRRDDLAKSLDGSHRKALDGYTLPYLDVAITVVLGALLVAYLVFTTDTEAMGRLGSTRLYATAPFVVYGILRYLQITLVWHRSGSPTRILLTDRPLQASILGWAATFAALMYLP